jgi:uncharacterized membrane protein YhaH (DUF805 family)
VQASVVSRRPWWTRERPDRALMIDAAGFAVVAIAIVLVAAVSVWALAPASWQSLIIDDQRTDATALTVLSIWANNVLICCLPLLGGVFAHRLVDRGRRGWARLVIAVAAVGATRSLLVIGLVGGLDPSWLATAAAWWILEVTALGACCAAGWHGFRNVEPVSASRQLAHALTFACATLGAAALVEVALT